MGSRKPSLAYLFTATGPAEVALVGRSMNVPGGLYRALSMPFGAEARPYPLTMKVLLVFFAALVVGALGEQLFVG